MEIKQNSIWMVRLGKYKVGHEQAGTRPFYVISNDRYNTNSKTPIGFFLSTSSKKASNRFTIDVGTNGVADTVNISQIRTLSEDRFIKQMDEGNNEQLSEIMTLFNSTIVQLGDT